MDMEKTLKELIDSIDYSTPEGQEQARELLETLQDLLKDRK